MSKASPKAARKPRAAAAAAVAVAAEPSERSIGAALAGATVREHRLENGLRLIVAERRADPVVAVMTWYRVGARNETERESGVSHFLEHMMFKGSRHFAKGEVDLVTTRLGGVNNAFTSYDHTAYWFELAADRWETALEIEADRMQGLSFDAREFEAERAVVLEEFAMGQDDPWRRLKDLVQAALFERHPYRRPIIGYADALRALEVADMRDYYRRFYHPANATIVVCGDVETQDVLERVRERFGALPSGPNYAEADAFRPVPAGPAGEKRVAMTWNDPGQRVCMAWPTVPFASDDDFALDVISTLLGGGRLARLHRKLVIDAGLATLIGCDNDTRVEGGLFWIMAECSHGKSAEELERAIDRELERLSRELVPARELRRVRALLDASEAYDLETATDLAEQIGEYATDADWRELLTWRERVASVDARAVRDCARRLLRPERRVVGLCRPAAAAPAARARARGRRS